MCKPIYRNLKKPRKIAIFLIFFLNFFEFFWNFLKFLKKSKYRDIYNYLRHLFNVFLVKLISRILLFHRENCGNEGITAKPPENRGIPSNKSFVYEKFPKLNVSLVTYKRPRPLLVRSATATSKQSPRSEPMYIHIL